jgi:AcrR family transcriptional regulator
MQTPISSHIELENDAVRRILGAAETCFARSGYDGASMREIAGAASVSKSLLHYHFQSKEHLFTEVQIRSYDRLAAKVTEAVSSLESVSDRGLLALDVLFEALREGDQMAAQAELWARAMSNHGLRVHVTRLRELVRTLLVQSMRRILGADGDKLPVELEAAADLVWSALNGLGIQAALGEDPERIARAVRALRALATMALDETRNSRLT